MCGKDCRKPEVPCASLWPTGLTGTSDSALALLFPPQDVFNKMLLNCVQMLNINIPMDSTAVRTQAGQRFQSFLQRTVSVLIVFIHRRHLAFSGAHGVVGLSPSHPAHPQDSLRRAELTHSFQVCLATENSSLAKNEFEVAMGQWQQDQTRRPGLQAHGPLSALGSFA